MDNPKYPTWEIIAGVFGTICIGLIVWIYTSHAAQDDSRFKDVNEQIDNISGNITSINKNLSWIQGALEAKGFQPSSSFLNKMNTKTNEAVNDK